MKRNAKKNKGITLIALVITIIVLLILAGVTIASLSGDNGILTRAAQSKEHTKKADAEEQIKLGLTEVLMESNLGKGTLETLLNNKFGSGNVTKNVEDGSFTIKKDGYQVKVDSKGTIVGEAVPEGNVVPPTPPQEEKEAIPETGEFDFIGCYADFEGDPQPDGIIFADLAKPTSGQWSDGDGAYTMGTEPKTNLNKYYIKETGRIDDRWDATTPKDVISLKDGTPGNERFYVMALKDVDETTHTWWANAFGKMENPPTETKTGFGEGKVNTKNILKLALENKYGELDQNDLWALDSVKNKIGKTLQEAESSKWFVPSRAEWAAFADVLKIGKIKTENGYDKHKLKDWYWSSSQGTTFYALTAYFGGGRMRNYYVNTAGPVRLAATF